jgi:hypothetical protein
MFIDYVDADYDFGGLAVDPNTGEFYGTNDDSTPFGVGLYRINMNSTGTLIAPYPDAQTDIDGLAVSNDGFAYLVIDQAGSIYVYDFVGGAYVTPLTNPWTSSEVFCGGAWIYEDASTGFFDDFDSYTAGQQLACQNPIDWTTWSNLPCDATEDPLISTNFSFSGANSTVILPNNDLVKLLGELTSGKWYISVFVYIPAGKAGYFNALAGFTPNPFNWGAEIYFDVGGGGRLLAGSATAVPFTWLENTWHQAMLVVDLDLDLAEFWIGTDHVLTMVHSWQWTLGASGGGSPLQLDAIDFFGATAFNEMYIDNFYFGDVMPPIIPVELTSFAANVNDGVVQLNWTTATETNNNGFAIERKSTNSEYTQIGFVPGFGTTTEPRSYSFTDNSVTPAAYSYRLKQVDYDGTFEYSSEVAVDVTIPLEFSLEQNYPNPFNPSTSIKYSIPENGFVTLDVYNLLGEKVASLVNGVQDAGRDEISFDASNLASGIYVYSLKSGSFTSVKKMLLMK